MNVLIGCEESGTVREAFRREGFDAWSNDTEDCSDNSKYHLRMDIFEAIERWEWDLIIMHPPCDHLTVAGNRWYGYGQEGFHQRLDAVQWTLDLWELACSKAEHVCMENPVGILPIEPAQYIQPFEFGHKETKNTGLWLHNLPKLRPTSVLEIPAPGTEERKEWEKVWRMGPSKDRKRLRSKTYEGIANAMADQWGYYIRNPEAGHNSNQMRLI